MLLLIFCTLIAHFVSRKHRHNPVNSDTQGWTLCKWGSSTLKLFIQFTLSLAASDSKLIRCPCQSLMHYNEGEMLSKISHFVVHNYMKCDRKQMVTIPLRKLEKGFEIWVIFNGWQRQSEWEVCADHSRPHWNIKSFLICSHCEQVALAVWQGDAGKSLLGNMVKW